LRGAIRKKLLRGRHRPIEVVATGKTTLGIATSSAVSLATRMPPPEGGFSQSESLRAISRLTGLDRKTVRRYVKAAKQAGCQVGEPAEDAAVGEVIGRVRAQGPGVRGSTWAVCAEHRELLAGWLDKQVSGIRYPVWELWSWRQKGRQTITAQRVRRGRRRLV
jgi:hypothetical protein